MTVYQESKWQLLVLPDNCVIIFHIWLETSSLYLKSSIYLLSLQIISTNFQNILYSLWQHDPVCW